ncbi:MAG: ribosome hibernation-promoting factor, HPF/YfiA family [Bosea sp. (in: a-proteobacteria)]
MGLRVSGKNLDVGEAIRTQAEDRVGSALGKYYEGSFNGHVTMARDGTGFRSDAVLHLSSGMTLEASGMAHDAYQSLDRMVDKIEKRLRRYKRRLKDHSGNAHARRALMEMPSYVIEAPNEDSEEDNPPEMNGTHPAIVAETTRSLHDLSVSDAVSELDLTGSPVLVFRNAGNGRVNIVYRRRDGNIGWIDPPTALS